jgi:hypothetical protein
MGARIALLSLVFLTGGCAVSMAGARPLPSANVVIVSPNQDRGRAPRGPARVPPGHYPPPGLCRIWYEGRPPGHQPRPVPCPALHRRVPAGAFVLYGGRAWDSLYDWGRHERRRPGSVPRAILQVLVTVR